MTHHFKPFWNRWFHSSQGNEVIPLESPRLSRQHKGTVPSFKKPALHTFQGEILLLMEETKPCTSRYGKYPIIYWVLYIPDGAGFLPKNPFPSKSPLPPKVRQFSCKCKWASAGFIEKGRSCNKSNTSNTSPYLFPIHRKSMTIIRYLLFQIRFGVRVF